MVWTSLEGDIGLYETEEEAMQAAQYFIDTELDEISPDDDVVVYKAIAQLQVTEIDSKAKAAEENREWDYPYDSTVEAKIVKCEGATQAEAKINMAMFSNGSEYLDFISESCENCKKFAGWEAFWDQVCPIEQALATCNITGENFPYDKVHPDEDGNWICEDFEVKP